MSRAANTQEFHQSSKYKSSLYIFIFIGLAVIGGSIQLHFSYQNWQFERTKRLREEQLRVDLAVKTMQQDLQHAINDLRRVAHSKVLKRYINATPQALETNREEFQNQLLNLANYSYVYDQLRFIDNNGYERVRVNASNVGPVAVDKQQLQNKSARYYFREAMKLAPEQVYFSPLDLNIEYGVTEPPGIPTIRIGTALFDTRGNRVGVLVFNYLATNTLLKLGSILAHSPGEVFLFDESGFSLHSAETNTSNDISIDTSKEFIQAFPQLWQTILAGDSGHVDRADGYFTFATLQQRDLLDAQVHQKNSPNHAWKFISRIPAHLTEFSASQVIKDNQSRALVFLLVIAVMSMVLVRLILENQRKRFQLASSEEQLKQLIKQAPDGIFIADTDGSYTDVNDSGCAILGLQREDIVGKSIVDFIPPKDVDRLQDSRNEMLSGKVHVSEWFLRHSEGNYVPVEISAKVLPDGQWQGFVRDISERKEIEFQLKLWATVIEHTQEAVLITDAKRHIISVNRAFTTITGYEHDEVVGKDPGILNSGEHPKEFYRDMWRALATTGQWQGEIRNRRKDGEQFPAWENISVASDDQGNIINYVGIMSDISDLKAAETRLSALAYSDALTGLANRSAFNVRLEQALKHAKRNKSKVALFFFDLNRFKLINDTLGHDAGDQVLKTVAQRIQGCVREEDTIARLGGDEFTVVLEDISHEQYAVNIARKIIKSIVEPINLDSGDEIVTSTSVGISIYPDNATNARDLIKNADIAMYRAKKEGTQSYAFFSADMAERAGTRMTLERELRRALADDQFRLYYQPQFELGTGKLCGVEALLRWQHPERGMIFPDEFIKVAEETRLIHDIGKWVIRQSVNQAATWKQSGLRDVRLGLNVSGYQLMYDHVLEDLGEALSESGFNPEDLLIQFELTESWLQIGGRVKSTLNALRQMGVSIAIDDFGTGYSSLSQLQSLPIDTLKIDRSFLANVPDNPDSTAIVKAIISMARSLGLRIIAEGVENPSQLDFLKEHSCNEVQGFYFSEAVCLDDIETRLQESILI